MKYGLCGGHYTLESAHIVGGCMSDASDEHERNASGFAADTTWDVVASRMVSRQKEVMWLPPAY